MPQIGNKCPGLQEQHTFKSGYCLNSCDHQCVPASVLFHIQNKIRTDKHVGQYISVTSLLGCLRQLYGERTLDYYVEPPKNWYTLRGSLLHALLTNPGFAAQIEEMRRYVYRLFRTGEASREDLEQRWIQIEAQLADFAETLPKKAIPDWESETEYEYPLGEINGKSRFLRGTIDVLRRVAQELLDYKTIGDRGLAFIKAGAKPDHQKQFNMYRFLVERGYPVGQKDTYVPVEITKIRAFYMTMMGVWGTGGLMDENTLYLKNEPDKHPNEVGRAFMSERKDLVLKKGKRKDTAQPTDYEYSVKTRWKITYAIPDVTLMDLNEVEAFIHERARILCDAFDKGIIPPMCDPEMRAWKCDNFCPDVIRKGCDDYNETVGESRVVETDDAVPVEGA